MDHRNIPENFVVIAVACDNLLLPTMQALRACTAGQLGACGRPVCRFPLYYADHPAPATACDCECEQGGQGIAWVRLVTITGSGTNQPATCAGGQFTATYELGVHRCGLAMDDMRTPVDQQKRDENTAAMVKDAAALRRTPQCCDFLADHDLTWQLQSVAPLGPQGGCVATTAQLQVAYVDCGGC